jgi:hypothetical protein
LGLDCDGGVAGAPRTRSTTGAGPGDAGDAVPGPARRLGASPKPHTPQNRAFGSSGELHDGHVMSTNFRRTSQPWHATFQQNAGE